MSDKPFGGSSDKRERVRQRLAAFGAERLKSRIESLPPDSPEAIFGTSWASTAADDIYEDAYRRFGRRQLFFIESGGEAMKAAAADRQAQIRQRAAVVKAENPDWSNHKVATHLADEVQNDPDRNPSGWSYRTFMKVL